MLVELHQLNPEKGYAAQALEISERARARRLLDLLAEARADARQGAPSELLERERMLRWQVNAKDTRRRQLHSGKRDEAQLAKVEQELRDLLAQYREAQARIRQLSPGYAVLTRPTPLSVAEIQRLLDEDTMLLEYLLGRERSLLWAVTPNAVTHFVLPKRAEIEAAARRVYELLKAARPAFLDGETLKQKTQRLGRVEAEYHRAAAALSQMLLSPVAAQLEKKRLVIVADGALHYVPFAALPAPSGDAETRGRGDTGTNSAKLTVAASPRRPLAASPLRPLIADHEIVPLPSATVLTLLRQQQPGRSAANKMVAVLADPVFSAEDARLIAQRLKDPKSADEKSLAALSRTDAVAKYSSLERSSREAGIGSFRRLKFSRDEAEAIAGLAPAGRNLVALDFAASRASATSGDLRQYRIIHFATHGLVNTQHPELSGLVLSLVNERGEAQDGFLRLPEIYNLKLNAELVVLSGCETALGKEIRGEGLIGLTCGFMYAGAPRVVASLWNVDDQATARLMKQFYQRMLGEGMTPAAALRAAQIAAWQEQPRAVPYAWAAFVLQGEWR